MKKMKKFLFLTIVLVGQFVCSARAVDVKVSMNSVSRTMSLVEKSTGSAVDVYPDTITGGSYSYLFTAPAGTYVLTGYASDETVNGTIELNVSDENSEFKVFTATCYAQNQGWTVGKEYTVEARVMTREGEEVAITQGLYGGTNATTSIRPTFLLFEGNSYRVRLVPSDSLAAEGYAPYEASMPVTGNVNVYGTLPHYLPYSVTAPKDATMFIGSKVGYNHFVPYGTVEPQSIDDDGNDNYVYHYQLAENTVYNYRVDIPGKVTQAGYFTMKADEAARPQLVFDANDSIQQTYGPNTVVHDVSANKGLETGNILLNINERGHLKMKSGETRDVFAMRSWELNDNMTNNYFIEPTFHYTVLPLEGDPVVLDRNTTNHDPWISLRAVSKGTAMILVTYDAIDLNYYSSLSKGVTKNPYWGGEFWGAIWPENTGVFIVTVDSEESGIDTGMKLNEKYNEGLKRLAGEYVDAEHDVFYYIDTDDGIDYTFTPSGVAEVTVAYPNIGERMATYDDGFSSEGVVKNDDGSYTVRLKYGRNIVCLTNAAGVSEYQVLNAKPVHREIINLTRPDANTYRPGDKLTVQYSGLFHPANKIAGIYNMSAYVTYNGVPNGESLILGSGQYTFASVPAAQAVTVSIDPDIDTNEMPEFIMNDGVIQVNGFGDPIGNHRNTLKSTGRNANFTALAHKTYFGALPDVVLPLEAIKRYHILPEFNIEDADISLVITKEDGKVLEAGSDGTYYTGSTGRFRFSAKASGYKTVNGEFTLSETDDVEQVIVIDFAPIGATDWDGTTADEPVQVDGVYQIATGSELYWFSKNIDSTQNAKAVLVTDIDLGGFDWTKIGTSSTTFNGEFDGQGHTVTGIYLDVDESRMGFFGATQDAVIKDLTVEGYVINKSSNYTGGLIGYAKATNVTGCVNRINVTGYQYVGGLIGSATGATIIDCCGNEANVTATYQPAKETQYAHVAGITPELTNAKAELTNCYNTGIITGEGHVATIIESAGANTMVKNNLDVGQLVSASATTGNVCADATEANYIENNYVVCHYENGQDYETVVTTQQLVSGEVAYLLGEAWGQEIGVDPVPVLGGMKVYLVDGSYVNKDNTPTSIVPARNQNEMSADVIYNIAGQKLAASQKGVNIVNGRKVWIGTN